MYLLSFWCMIYCLECLFDGFWCCLHCVVIEGAIPSSLSVVTCLILIVWWSLSFSLLDVLVIVYTGGVILRCSFVGECSCICLGLITLSGVCGYLVRAMVYPHYNSL